MAYIRLESYPGNVYEQMRVSSAHMRARSNENYTEVTGVGPGSEAGLAALARRIERDIQRRAEPPQLTDPTYGLSALLRLPNTS